jgi:hypothetical protein
MQSQKPVSEQGVSAVEVGKPEDSPGVSELPKESPELVISRRASVEVVVRSGCSQYAEFTCGINYRGS